MNYDFLAHDLDLCMIEQLSLEYDRQPSSLEIGKLIIEPVSKVWQVVRKFYI